MLVLIFSKSMINIKKGRFGVFVSPNFNSCFYLKKYIFITNIHSNNHKSLLSMVSNMVSLDQ